MITILLLKAELKFTIDRPIWSIDKLPFTDRLEEEQGRRSEFQNAGANWNVRGL